MKLQKLLFSFDGRIGRRTYWLAIVRPDRRGAGLDLRPLFSSAS